MRKLQVIILAAICALSNSQAANAQGYTPDILELDGSNPLSISPETAFNIVGYGTIEFWVTPDWTDDPGYDPTIISTAGVDGVSLLIAMLRERNGIGIVSGEQEYLVAYDFTDGQLHHVAISDYGDTLMVYIDLELVGRFQTALTPLPSSGLFIGSADGSSFPFAGAIAGLRFWEVPVDPAVITSYVQRNVLGADHPDEEYLTAMSDFTNRDMVVFEVE